MPPPYCYDYPRPAVTVDLVVFTLDDGRLKHLLIRRKAEPDKGRWALPGGFLDLDEPAEAGARRELKEETGLEGVCHVAPLGFFDDPKRDPRGRTISLAFAGVVRGPAPRVAGGDDAAEAGWLDPDGEELSAAGYAFDHQQVVDRARDWLARGASAGPLGLALLPDAFTRRDVERLDAALGGLDERPGRWLRRLAAAGMVAAMEGRPGRFRAVGDG